MAIIMPCQDTMPGFSHHELDDVHTPSSDFGYSQATTMLSSPAPGMFPSFSQTGPADLNGSAWESTVEGTQNFADFQDHGVGDAYSPFTLGQVTPTAGEEGMEDFHSKWHMPTVQDAVPIAVSSEPMRRITSRSSTGSHKHGVSSKSRRRLRVTLAQTPQLSYEQIAGNASMNPSRMVDVNQYLDMDTSMGVPPQGLYPVGLAPAYSPNGLPYGTMAPALSQHVDPTCTQMDFEPGLTANSPTHSWDSYSSGLARTPSPSAGDDAWTAPRLASSPTDTTGSSPVFQGQSPRISRKYGNQPHLVDDLQVRGIPEEFSLPPAFGPRVGGGEVESPRDHHLYKQATPQADGMFHCPWEGDESCNHKPEKLKCNYDKFVDSHLKPYRCKLEACENARFSSTACLLRHEREAHGMHGHGDKPFMCTYEGCDRAQVGNGFPRHWNLKDHMKRVHNDVAPAQVASTTAGSPPPSGSSQAQAKTRKRKKDAAEVAASSGRKSSLKAQAQAQVQAQPQVLTPAPAPVSKAENRMAKAYQKWHEHQQRLTDLVSGFSYPDDPNMMQYLKDAQDQLDAMSRLSAGVISKKSSSSRGEYRRSYTSQSG